VFPFINLFGQEYPTLSILGLVGFFLAVIVAGFRAKRFGLTRSDLVYIGVFAGLGLLVGSFLFFGLTRISFVWENRDYFPNFTTLIFVLFGGMVFYGGLFGAIAGIFLYSRIMKVPFGTAMILTIPVFPLAHSIMRIGCFAGGCCHGIPFPSPLGIAFTNAVGAPNNIPLLPVQLYEAAANLLIFGIMWCYTIRDRSWVATACLYGLIYSFVRFWLEFLRGDAIRGFVIGLSTSQFISIAVFIVCAIGLSALSHNKPVAPE